MNLIDPRHHAGCLSRNGLHLLSFCAARLMAGKQIGGCHSRGNVPHHATTPPGCNFKMEGVVIRAVTKPGRHLPDDRNVNKANSTARTLPSYRLLVRTRRVEKNRPTLWELGPAPDPVQTTACAEGNAPAHAGRYSYRYSSGELEHEKGRPNPSGPTTLEHD